MKVLIVDDGPTNRKLLRVQLESEGFATVEAADGIEALKKLECGGLDVVITDILMPNLDGYQLCHRIRKNRRFHQIPIIAYTSTYTSPADEKLSLNVGADRYLKKPARPEEIIRTIRELTAARRKKHFPARRQPKELSFMRVYSHVLVRKLEEKNTDLATANRELEKRNDEISRHLGRIGALHEIDLAISSTLDLKSVLEILLEKLERFFPFSTAATVRLSAGPGEIPPLAAFWNLDQSTWLEEEKIGGGELALAVLQSGEPLKIDALQSDERIKHPFFYAKNKLFSCMAAPLAARRKRLGILTLYAQEARQFTGEDAEFLKTLAAQASIAINNARLYEKTKRQSEELQKSNRVKDEFLSVMSHELRTPLSVVMGYAGIIKEGTLGEINPKQKETMDKILSRAADQLVMINDIMHAAQIESRVLVTESDRFSLREFLQMLESDYATREKTNVYLRFDYPKDLPTISTDSGKLKRILQNLINNAIKFTARGSVTVSAKVTEGSRRQAVSSEQSLPTADCLLPTGGRWVEFVVSDSGIGIPKENIARIFEKFYQVDSSETRLYGGVGLGLYIVKNFTELLGGKIEVESEPGKGSRFTVTIPS